MRRPGNLWDRVMAHYGVVAKELPDVDEGFWLGHSSEPREAINP